MWCTKGKEQCIAVVRGREERVSEMHVCPSPSAPDNLPPLDLASLTGPYHTMGVVPALLVHFLGKHIGQRLELLIAQRRLACLSIGVSSSRHHL